MSTNSKNTIRNAFMMNFTTKKKHRYILTETGSEIDTYIQNNINSINDSVNVAIQELSIKITNRQLPYIIIEKMPITLDTIGNKYVNENDKIRRTRGMIRDIETEKSLIKQIEKELSENEISLSHSIEFFAQSNYNELTFSNHNFDAKILLNKNGLKTIFTDVFLDSAMFNSYSFLKDMSQKDKQEFGLKKLDFYKKRNLSCFYIFDDNGGADNVLYYSLAFSCRKSIEEFDYDSYIELWDAFISEYYPNKKHKEKKVSEQLKQYIDPNQLPNDLETKIMNKEEGAYLILRINHDRTTSLHKRINNYFGISKYEVGKTKIVKISEYYEIKDMLRNLDVAAYKVVRLKRKNNKE